MGKFPNHQRLHLVDIPARQRPLRVMVTLILAFIFLTPLWVNFRDKPQERPPHQTEVVVQQEGDGFIYKVDASAVKADSDADIRESLLAHHRAGRR